MNKEQAKELFTNNKEVEFAYVDQDGYSDGIFLTGEEWLIDLEAIDDESWGNPDFIEK